jgi:biotin carboxyl carrier protein
MTTIIELTVSRVGERTFLIVPEVGMFTRALPAGTLLSPGQHAGYLSQLGFGHVLIVPPGVTGRIISMRSEKVHLPLGFGDVVYELEPIEAGEESDAIGEAENLGHADGMVMRAPHTGRFWHRPSPDDPAFCKAGDTLSPGSAVGLIEIMKTFTQIGYTPTAGLPSNAKIVRMLADDGADVTAGTPLIAVEPS